MAQKSLKALRVRTWNTGIFYRIHRMWPGMAYLVPCSHPMTSLSRSLRCSLKPIFFILFGTITVIINDILLRSTCCNSSKPLEKTFSGKWQSSTWFYTYISVRLHARTHTHHTTEHHSSPTDLLKSTGTLLIIRLNYNIKKKKKNYE